MKLEKQFIGYNLKLARLINGLSLADIAENFGISRQYIHQLETNERFPSDELLEKLAALLNVTSNFFYFAGSTSILDEENIHFRSNRTAKQSSRLKAKAYIEIFIRLIDILGKGLQFPDISFPKVDINTISAISDIENAAEYSRSYWELGIGPIANMTRTVERAGAIVTFFKNVSSEVDALSSVIKRPIIIRNDTKDSPGRLRFDIAHELGHIVMHEGVATGCKLTESQANRYASAFLLPKISFIKEFKVGSRMDWQMLSELKSRWRVSKAALLYRARQLDLLSESRYKSHVIMLNKYEAKKEKDDYLIKTEKSELIVDAIKNYLSSYFKTVDDLLLELGVTDNILNQILDFDINTMRENYIPHNVVSLFNYRK